MAALQLQEKAMEQPLRVVTPLVPKPQAVGYALHPENRTLQPVQRRFLGLSSVEIEQLHPHFPAAEYMRKHSGWL
jgi:hypothetical protein